MQSKDRIGLVGYGNQGEAWALNLRDSGWGVSILARPDSIKSEKAQRDGFEVRPLDTALSTYDIIALLIPDDAMPSFFVRFGRHFREGQSLLFAHGFALHYQTADWPAGCDRILLAPKGIGRAVRSCFQEGRGVPAVFSVEHDHTGRAEHIARSVAEGIGATRAGLYPATVRDEVEADLFSEQALLCGGLPALVIETYSVLVERGVSPEVAYLECVHELAFMADLFQERGLHQTLLYASPTAQYGGFEGGKQVVSQEVRQSLLDLFDRIRKGEFVQKLSRESKSGYRATRRALDGLRKSPLEQVGAIIRKRLEGEVK